MLLKNKAVLTISDLKKGKFGLEREVLRITADGEIATTDHPAVFGDRTKHPYIVTDFAESQVEMVTGVHENLEDAYKELVMINQTVSRSIGDEILWPYSMPPKFNWEHVRISAFPDSDEGNKARQYREYLNEKYGNDVQLICGIHYNFSYSDGLLRKMFEAQNTETDYGAFVNSLYMKIAKKYMNYHWFLVFMLGKTPIANTIDAPTATSLRNSHYGYQNKVDLDLSYESIGGHIGSIRKAMDAGLIIDEREVYAPVRVKCLHKCKLMSCLEKNGISYLEIRSIDLNPRAFAGITLEELKFIQLFTLALLELDEHVTFDPKRLAVDAALFGDDFNEELFGLTNKVIDKMREINDEFNLNLDTVSEILEMSQDIEKLDFLELAKTHKGQALDKPYQTYGHDDMEMSTQLLIAEAVRRGIKYEVIDRRANFLKLVGNGNLEYVKQATKTSLDTYVAFLAMENKEVTKVILDNAGFRVPAGETFFDVDHAMEAFDKFANKEIVVKPKTTNFGLGIVMFKPLTNEQDYKNALEIAFGFDDEVLVEEFLHGQEYRFLVIGNKCLSVLKRVAANVVGDGTSTIAQLVEKKNEHPWRATGHTAPLEKIVLGEIELLNLEHQDLTPDSVLEAGVRVDLRDNSNISTGGDSVEVTNETHEFFKQQAIAASHAIGAKICGADLIINGELSNPESDYGIIELNFNPAIHMHAFTLEGDGINVAPDILEALGLVE